MFSKFVSRGENKDRNIPHSRRLKFRRRVQIRAKIVQAFMIKTMTENSRGLFHHLP